MTAAGLGPGPAGWSVLLVLLGGALGAAGRYLVDRAVQARHDSAFPFGTLVVNVAGSLVLGGLVGAGPAVPAVWSLTLGTGLCGALTTYSTFSFECWRLAEERRWGLAVLNAAGTVVVCIAAAACGFVLVQSVVGGGR